MDFKLLFLNAYLDTLQIDDDISMLSTVLFSKQCAPIEYASMPSISEGTVTDVSLPRYAII